jgi:hypothetical protein
VCWVLSSFVDWFLNVNWISWNSLGAVGQIAGAIAAV